MTSHSASSPLVSALAIALLLAAALGCAPGGEDAPEVADAPDEAAAEVDPAYAGEVEAWRAERRESLAEPDGWLSLAGLFWLEEGEEATLGSAPDSDFVFPEKAPAEIGTLVLEEGEVVLTPRPGVALTHEGEPVEGPIVLHPDVTVDRTDLELGSFVFHAIERGDKTGIRLKDRESPALEAFDGLDYYPLDPAWIVEARLEPGEAGKTVPIPNVLGQINHEPSPGTLVFTADGREHRLEPIGEPGEAMFVVFGDRTNGRGTYGGGRFVYTGEPDAEGRVTIDFNRAYNPPCAFTPYATCPLPPPSNKLAVAIEAGEKGYDGPGH